VSQHRVAESVCLGDPDARPSWRSLIDLSMWYKEMVILSASLRN
jgi:hypothetical protein